MIRVLKAAFRAGASRRAHRACALLALTAALAGCATALPPAPPRVTGTAGAAGALRAPGQVDLSGRINIVAQPPDAATATRPTANRRVYSAQFDLHGSAERGWMSLSSPLGSTLAQAHWEPGDVTLRTANGDTRHFSDLQTMSQAMLGESVPLQDMLAWMQGHPSPDHPSTPLPGPGESGAGPRSFEQSGWQVDLDAFRDGRVVATRQTPYPVRIVVMLDAP